jgi:hypothetical protein
MPVRCVQDSTLLQVRQTHAENFFSGIDKRVLSDPRSPHADGSDSNGDHFYLKNQRIKLNECKNAMVVPEQFNKADQCMTI